MSSIKIVDKYHIEFETSSLGKEHNFIAKCVNIKVFRTKHVADVRVVSKKALRYYMTECFPRVMTSPGTLSYRKSLFLNIKQMYESVYVDFMESYYPKAGYKERLNKDLYLHQKETLSSSIYRNFNFYALEQGLGKTLTAATLSKITGSVRTVVVCPSLVKFNWFSDMTRDWGFNPIYWTVLDAKKNKSMYAFRERFVVLNFEQVEKQMKYLLKDRIDHIIVDEVHYCKNHMSRRSKSLQKLINLSNEQKTGKTRVTLMSGTPITNRIHDLFNYLKIVEHPLGQNFEEFKRRYTITASVRGGKVIGAKNIDDLKGKISNFMIRLKSEDCMDLPDMVIEKFYLSIDDISDEYKKEIEALREKKTRYDLLQGKEKQKMNYEIKANIHTLNKIVSTSKVPKIIEFVDNLIDQGENVVIFSGYTAPLEKLENHYGDRCVKIDGSINAHKRQTLVDKFRDKDHVNVFLGNYQAAGVGINLVNSRHVIMMNMPFVPADIEQAQKRLHRGGQKNRVFVYYTLAEKTIDDHIYQLVTDKSKDINSLVDGEHKGVVNYSSITKRLFSKLLGEETVKV